MSAEARNEVPLLRVSALVKHFRGRRRAGLFKPPAVIRAVDGVSFCVARGETLGLVGESGCGKTTTGRLVLHLIEPTSGRVLFDGQDIVALDARARRALRRRMQIVFQDPFGSLNPRLTVAEIIGEPLLVHRVGSAAERRARVSELLGLVGLADYHARRFAHEFSGGQRQRICIARALALNPDFLVCDEAVSALDVSIQAQIINLLQDLKRELGLTYLFISHDLGVIRHICDRVAVMYLGEIVEVAGKRELFQHPAHPYTRGLLEAVPVPRAGRRRYRPIEGDVPSPANPPPGCRFHTRCRHAFARCRSEAPLAHPLGAGHSVACHLYDPAAPNPLTESAA